MKRPLADVRPLGPFLTDDEKDLSASGGTSRIKVTTDAGGEIDYIDTSMLRRDIAEFTDYGANELGFDVVPSEGAIIVKVPDSNPSSSNVKGVEDAVYGLIPKGGEVTDVEVMN